MVLVALPLLVIGVMAYFRFFLGIGLVSCAAVAIHWSTINGKRKKASLLRSITGNVMFAICTLLDSLVCHGRRDCST